MLRIERRMQVSPYLHVSIPLCAIFLALAVGALFLVFNGFDPLLIYKEMFLASFATLYGLEDALISATPLIFTGLAAAVTFRFKLYNIGGEGQLVMGGIGAAAAAIMLGNSLPSLFTIPLVLVAGVVSGAAWMLIPAVSRIRFGTSEIITTLLLNYVAILLARYFIYGSRTFLRDPTSTNFPQGSQIPAESIFPTFSVFQVPVGFLIGCFMAVLVFSLIRWTRFGYAARVIGDSSATAKYAGINVSMVTLALLLISAGLAGLAGAAEVAGRSYRLDPSGLAVGFGYAGIIVAALALYNPLAIIPVSILFGGLTNAGSTLQSLSSISVPSSISTILQGAILIFLLAGELFLLYNIRFNWLHNRAFVKRE